MLVVAGLAGMVFNEPLSAMTAGLSDAAAVAFVAGFTLAAGLWVWASFPAPRVPSDGFWRSTLVVAGVLVLAAYYAACWMWARVRRRPIEGGWTRDEAPRRTESV